MLPNSLLVATMLLFQYPYPVQRMPRAPQGVGIQGANTDAVATFDGTFKSADKKYLTIEVENGQVLRMFISGSTKFFRDDKPAKAADFHADEKITVDASRDSKLNLMAVRVATVPPKAPGRQSEKSESPAQ